jgi:2-methylaconitate cis-trans-isomerase PrpF
LPRLALVAPAQNHRLPNGADTEVTDHDVVVRAMSMQRAHHACPLTTAMCLAAATFVPGTIAAEVAPGTAGASVRIAHPKGVASIDVATESDPEFTGIRSVSVVRTARRLLEGTAYVVLKQD